MKFILALAFVVLSLLGQAQSITPAQAKDSIGKTITVCGTVTGTHTAASGVTFLYMGGKYPNNAFTVVVFAADATKFTYKLDSLAAKDICVRGFS